MNERRLKLCVDKSCIIPVHEAVEKPKVPLVDVIIAITILLHNNKQLTVSQNNIMVYLDAIASPRHCLYWN